MNHIIGVYEEDRRKVFYSKEDPLMIQISNLKLIKRLLRLMNLII